MEGSVNMKYLKQATVLFIITTIFSINTISTSIDLTVKITKGINSSTQSR